MNVAGIGAGGMGGGDIATVARLGANIVALCDVDDERAAGSFQAFPKARRYKDFRVMLEKEANAIDAVTVGTPDHIHAVASMAAIRAGKHVYCQKPLTHTLHECRELTKAGRGGRRRHADGKPGTCHRGCPAHERVDSGRRDRVGAGGPRLVRPGRPALEAGDPPAQPRRPPSHRLSTGISGSGRSASGLTTRLMPRFSGAAGGISAPARSATWAATSSIIPSGP